MIVYVVEKMRTLKLITLIIAAVAAAMMLVSADASAVPGTLDTGNTAWIMICTALVFIMTPGVAIFYGGLLRKQSMTSTIAQTCIIIAIMSLSWFVVGYSLAFGTSGGVIGDFSQILLRGMTYSDVDGLPSMLFPVFQCAFALITAGIVVGASIERIRFGPMALFMLIWSIIVYAPMAHLVWSGGFESFGLTVLDFAGGTVVHICAATTGLALAYFLGKRSTRIVKDRPHNIPMVFLGFALLWIGWLGFNGGSGLAADGIAVNAIIVTQIAMAAAMVSWAGVQYLKTGKVGVVGMVTGGLAGLVSITPAAGYVGPAEAIVIGLVGGALCYFAVQFMRQKSGADDALDVFGVHGVGGIWGSIATGIFAIEGMAQGSGTYGLIYGGVDLFVGQIVAVVFTLVFCFAITYAVIWIISKFMRVRMEENEEVVGADIAEHGEPAYDL